MEAILYLLKRHYINKIKRAFSSVVSTIITVVAVFGLGSSFVLSFIAKRQAADGVFSETIMAGIILLIGVILYNSFLSRDTGILTMADANFLFSGPFEKRTVLAYILISTAPVSVLTALFICFYFPYILGAALTVPKFIVVLLVISLLFGCIYLSYYYFYILDIEKPGFKKNARIIFLTLIGVLVLVFVVLFIITSFDLKQTSQRLFTHYLYNLFPLFGWAKWAISSLLTENILFGFIPAVALLVFVNVILCIALYNTKTDFYEKTLEDSINLQKLLDDKKANGNVDVRSVAKLKKKASNVEFSLGAGAIYSRQKLESNKLSLGARYRELYMGLIYLAFGVIFGLDFYFVMMMIGFSSLTMSLNDSWHREFKKPYVFLIPASSFSKLIVSILPGLTKTLISGVISITIAGLVYKLEPVNLIGYLLIFASFVVLFIFAEVLTYRMIGPSANAVAVTFMRMCFALATFIPAIVVIVVVSFVLNDIPNMLVTAACLLLTNLLTSTLLAFLSRGIFENSEIMD
ncbi:putative ABC exporter domain-containing protein [Ruminiclostridium herbifermentans]|uniref:Putative ABC exporter domain-containing protein n=1 Tax=Ruminiclostridium herbifermentans TaxID=2488810 RepID=A0A4U7JL88_9FIRM|nr:putative ABC exporter domain-containing protein [Ruminiclostridium herbifermentans]QNU65941.1 putative ABC exporter domain-containing protein [Ruminiclostridium herbifermentans]